MKIHLTEEELRNYIANEVKNLITCKFKEYDYTDRVFNLLSEGLIQTYEPNKIKRIIERKFNLSDIGAKIIIYDRTTPHHPIKLQKITKPVNTTGDYNKLVEIYISFKSGHGLTKCDSNILEEIIKTFDVCGWMFASIINMNTLEEHKDINKCNFTNKYIAYNMYFRPKFDQNVNINGVYEEE